MDPTDGPGGRLGSATPNVARMYDYFLGGRDNFAADRAAAEQIISVLPEIRYTVKMNRAFMRRAVRLAAEAGIRQFLDIGSGLPTQGNVHEVARAAAPDSRVVYVDKDPVVVAHGRGLLTEGDTRVAVTQGDLRRPEGILADPAVRALIDFDLPVAVLLVSVLHFVADSDKPAVVVGRLRAAMTSGSYLVLSHGTAEARPEAADTVVKVYKGTTSPIFSRSRAQIMDFFGGLELLAPGLVWVSEWGADPSVDLRDPSRSVNLGGVARKP